MSEKKILCMEMESHCVKCGSRNLCSICATIKRYKSWPTREQAIERMAKALKKVIYILSEEACLEGCEAALNALLENNK